MRRTSGVFDWKDLCTRQHDCACISSRTRVATWPWVAAVAGAIFIVPVRSDAQAELAGSVLGVGETRVGIASAIIDAAGIGIRAVTDSAGRFRLTQLPAGTHRIVIRALGFAAETVHVTFAEGESLFRDFLLRPKLTTLDEVRVEAAEPSRVPAKLVGFYERRRVGIGRFLDRDAIARFENRRTGDMLSMLPGITIRTGRSKAWASGGRGLGTNQGAFAKEPKTAVLDGSDIAAGAQLACYMDVYLDGALVYNSSARLVPLFDVNSIQPSEIEAVEVYAGAAQTPAQYNRTSGGCGVLLIWTRAR